VANGTSGIHNRIERLHPVLSYSNGYSDQTYADDEFWDAFNVEDDYVPRTPWYRKTARLFAVLIVAGMIATGALIPWGELIDRLDSVSEPEEILLVADQVVAESPYGWLVTEVRVRDIPDSTTGGFVLSNPADGVITLDRIGWDPEELRSTVAHEVGHLIDFAAYGRLAERRDGLGSEAWAECAAVDAGFRRADSDFGDTAYHCTGDELEQYRFSMSLLGEACKSWGDQECRPIGPIEIEK
jgi:hypothetical protein